MFHADHAMKMDVKAMRLPVMHVRTMRLADLLLKSPDDYGHYHGGAHDRVQLPRKNTPANVARKNRPTKQSPFCMAFQHQ